MLSFRIPGRGRYLSHTGKKQRLADEVGGQQGREFYGGPLGYTLNDFGRMPISFSIGFGA
jgi:hypothetical protein